jgi:hypothetical protein
MRMNFVLNLKQINNKYTDKKENNQKNKEATKIPFSCNV